MLDTKNIDTTKIPENCFEGKQLGVNPVNQPETTSEKAFENRYIDVGDLKTQEMNLKGGAKLKMSGGSKKRKNLYNLKELVSHCPSHLQHVNFYRHQNKYNSHGVSQKYSSEINKLLVTLCRFKIFYDYAAFSEISTGTIDCQRKPLL